MISGPLVTRARATATTHKHALHMIRQLFDLQGLSPIRPPLHSLATHKDTHPLIMPYPLLIRAAQLPGFLTASTSASRLHHRLTFTLILSEQGAVSMSVVISLLTQRTVGLQEEMPEIFKIKRDLSAALVTRHGLKSKMIKLIFSND